MNDPERHGSGWQSDDNRGWAEAGVILGKPVGRYILLYEIGSGGFGRVFAALEPDSGSRVAIKQLLPHHLSNPEMVQRFRNEAIVTRRLNSLGARGVATVLDEGESDGLPYFVMELIKGKNLDKMIEKKYSAREAATLVAQIAETVAVANRAEVFHRDVKPSNIRIRCQDGMPILLDFGLAKDASQHGPITNSKDVFGTERYMAPERFGRDKYASHTMVDVYGLGVVLYELIAMRPPFPINDVRDLGALRHQICHIIPPPPSRFRIDSPGALDAVCLKCLEKNPYRRYQSADIVADELYKFLGGRPVEARLPSMLRRLMCRCGGHPVATVAVVLLVVLGTAGGIATRIFATKAESAQVVAATASREKDLEAYCADMLLVAKEWSNGNTPRAQEVLHRHLAQDPHRDYRGFEWYYLERLLQSSAPFEITDGEAYPLCLALNADGSKLAASDGQSFVTLWDPRSRTMQWRLPIPARHLAFSHDGQNLVLVETGDTGWIQILSASSGEQVSRFSAGAFASLIAVHPRDNQLLSANSRGSIHRWRIPDGTDLGKTTFAYSPSVRPTCLTYSRNGDFVGMGGDGSITLWQESTQRVVFYREHDNDGVISGMDIDPTGRYVVTQLLQGTLGLASDILVWDLQTGRRKCHIFPHMARSAPLIGAQEAEGMIDAPDQFVPLFSADGSKVYTSGRYSIQVWSTSNGAPLDQLGGYSNPVVAIAASADRRVIAGASRDGVLRTWSVETGRGPYRVLRAYDGIVGPLAVNPEGTQCVALCDLSGNIASGLPDPPASPTYTTLSLIDTLSGRIGFQRQIAHNGQPRLHFRDKGTKIAYEGGTIFLGESPPRMQDEPTNGFQEVGSPDDAVVLRFMQKSPSVEVCSGELRRRHGELLGHTGTISRAAVSGDASLIATAATDGTIRVWASKDQMCVHVLSISESVTVLTFSPDGRMLASGTETGDIHLWDVQSGLCRSVLRGHTREVTAIDFLDGGKRIVSSSGFPRRSNHQGGDVRVWNPEIGRCCLVLAVPGAHVYPGLAVDDKNQRVFASLNPVGEISPGRIVCWETALAAPSK